MDGEDHGRTTGEDAGPTDVFELVGNDTRLAVLRALASAQRESPADPWLSYSELREAAGVRDKGNFNYHLDRLDDLLLRGDEGYCISALGVQVVSAVASGAFDPDWTWGPVDVEGDCVVCGDPVHLRYADGCLRLECGTDEHARYLPGTPNLLAEHAEATVVERVSLLLHQEVALLRRGVCAACHGSVDGRLQVAAGRSESPAATRPEESSANQSDPYEFYGDCRGCGLQYGFAVGTMVLPHPAVIGFFEERGIDVRTEPFWTLPFCRPGHETVVSEEPLRVRIDVERPAARGDETLSLTLDREAAVVSVDRPGGPPPNVDWSG